MARGASDVGNRQRKFQRLKKGELHLDSKCEAGLETLRCSWYTPHRPRNRPDLPLPHYSPTRRLVYLPPLFLSHIVEISVEYPESPLLLHPPPRLSHLQRTTSRRNDRTIRLPLFLIPWHRPLGRSSRRPPSSPGRASMAPLPRVDHLNVWSATGVEL